jgi:hypothetical protein
VAEQDPIVQNAEEGTPVGRPERRSPDLLTLLAGLLSLAVASMALGGWMPGFPIFDPRWLLAGGAILVGVMLLAASVRPAHRHRPDERRDRN